MALRKTKGRKKLKPISQRGKGERRITFAQSRDKAASAKSTAPTYSLSKSTQKRKGVTRKITKAGMNYGLVVKNRKANSSAKSFIKSTKAGTKTGTGSTLSTRLKQAKLNAKSKVKTTGRKMANWSAKKKAAMKKLWASNKKS